MHVLVGVIVYAPARGGDCVCVCEFDMIACMHAGLLLRVW
jgi:hypothetical protein